jgi:hypothetical protein
MKFITNVEQGGILKVTAEVLLQLENHQNQQSEYPG